MPDILYALILMSLEHRFIGFGCGRVPEEVIYTLDDGRLLNIFYRYLKNENILFVIKYKTHKYRIFIFVE